MKRHSRLIEESFIELHNQFQQSRKECLESNSKALLKRRELISGLAGTALIVGGVVLNYNAVQEVVGVFTAALAMMISRQRLAI